MEEKVKAILAEHGIRMAIGGCGCCGSPWVTFEYKGEKIVEDQDGFSIDMFKDE